MPPVCRPGATYAPWFETVLKAARVAVKVIKTLASLTRASKMSFEAMLNALTQCPETDPDFISRQVRIIGSHSDPGPYPGPMHLALPRPRTAAN